MRYFLLILCIFYTSSFGQEFFKWIQPITKITLQLNPEELKCLADNAYFEARGEGIKGMFAVTNVVFNRLANKSFPGSICEVIYQYKQFSWVELKNKKIDDPNAYQQALSIAEAFLRFGNYYDITNGSLWYHEIQINPIWASELRIAAMIGNHVFYRKGDV